MQDRLPLRMLLWAESDVQGRVYAKELGWKNARQIPCKNGNGVWVVQPGKSTSFFSDIKVYRNNFEKIIETVVGFGDKKIRYRCSQALAKSHQYTDAHKV